MTILSLNALSVTLGTPLFQNLNLTITKGDRIGVVAANGRGKSTLLRCLAGTLEPTSGVVTRARGAQIGHVQQNLPEDALDVSFYDYVLSALSPDQADFEAWRVDVLLDELEVPYDLQHQKLNALSGGWQRTAMLAAAWIGEPDVLLLDEPTNHLDLQRIALLENWLSGLSTSVTVVIISHDRAFLDATTTRTLFLRPEASRVYQLPFSAARAALAEADEADARRFANDLNKAQQLRRQAAKLKNIGVNSGSDLLLVKTKALNARAAHMEATARPAHRETSAGDIRLANSGTHAKALITLDNAEVTTPDGQVLYRTGQKWITRGDRVVLLGANGTGKSQLVKRIARAFDSADTQVKCTASLLPAYSDQHLGQLFPSRTPIDIVTGQFDIGDKRARAVLAGAGVSKQMQDKKISALSGGQKARLAMLVLRLKEPNFYLLDEPTNHLDIEGQEALEDELAVHQATCLLVSHDRSFLRHVGNRFWWINGKKLEEVDSPEPFLQSQMR